MGPRTILEVSRLSFRFSQDSPWRLRDLSFEIRQGQTTLLMGPSGCGKSTLALLLAGLYPEYAGLAEGSVRCRSGEIRDLGAEVRARLVSIVFQNPDDQFAMETAEGEIFFALENVAFKGDYGAKASELLSMAGLAGFERRKVLDLSGGEKQRLSLATALASEPRLLILDEPLANLDHDSSRQIARSLERLAQDGMSLLIIDHHPDPWLGWLDRIMLLDEEGRPVNLDLSPDEAKRETGLVSDLKLYGPEASHRPSRRPLPEARRTTALRATDLSLKLGRRLLWSQVSFKAAKGSITAITGPSGSGKSNLLMALAGFRKTGGRIEMYGRPGLVFQNPGFQFLTQKVHSEIILSLSPDGRGYGDRVLAEKALSLAAEFGLAETIGRSPWQLSQGQQRRLAVLTMLAAGKDILFLDEPTYAQDQVSTDRIMALLAAEVEKGLTAVMVTHDLDLARAHADQTLTIEDRTLKALPA
jgi:energy-coupling factor transport system ATP-binding protein